jgi:hypothetical protein
MRYARLAAQLASTKVNMIRNIAGLPEHAFNCNGPRRESGRAAVGLSDHRNI